MTAAGTEAGTEAGIDVEAKLLAPRLYWAGNVDRHSAGTCPFFVTAALDAFATGAAFSAGGSEEKTSSSSASQPFLITSLCPPSFGPGIAQDHPRFLSEQMSQGS